MKYEHARPFLDFLQLFQKISIEEQELIGQSVALRHVKEGEVLLQEGKLATNLFFICKGILKIVTVNEKGNKVIQFFLKENQFCTILNSLNNNIPAHESIVAACNADLLVFTKEKLTRLYEAIPYFKSLIGSIVHQALLDKIDIKNAYFGEDASTRYRKFLLRQPDIALRVPLGDVASYLGITQQSLSRIRKNTW